VFKEVHDYLNEVKKKVEDAKKSDSVACLVCGRCVVKNGRNYGKQQYLCKHCGKSFSQRSTNALSNSHTSDAVWKAVIRDP